MSCSPCGYHNSNSSCMKCITHKIYIKDSITAWYSKLTDTWKLLVDSTVPAIRKSWMKYWWSQELNELRRKAIESHRAWKKAHKCSSGPIAVLMKDSKYKYKSCLW